MYAYCRTLWEFVSAGLENQIDHTGRHWLDNTQMLHSPLEQ